MNRHTFVIMAYKQSEHLSECIRSLQEQTEPGHVVISTSTPSVWLSDIAVQSGIPIHVRQGESGIEKDWNFALTITDSEYVTLAHQDDVFHKEYASNLMKITSRYPDASIIFSDYAELFQGIVRKITANLVIKRILLFPMIMKNHLRSTGWKRRILTLGNPICCPAVTYHRSLIPDFRFNPDFSINLDWDAWLRIAELPGRFVYIRKIRLFHRIHDQSETSQGIGDNRRRNEDERIFRRLWPAVIAKTLTAVYALSYKSNT